jgi:hypothetical protein
LKPDALFLPPVTDVKRYVVRNRPWSWYELDRRLVARFGPGRVIAVSGGVPLAWEFSGDDLSIVMSDWQWYIVQNRPGFFSEVDRRLIARFGPGRVIASKWSVPLVWAFSRDDVTEVARALIGRISSPSSSRFGIDDRRNLWRMPLFISSSISRQRQTHQAE